MTPVEIRLPELAGGTEREQLQSIKSYLYTLAQQLQFAFDTVARQEAAPAARQAGVSQPQESRAEFSAIKALILKSAQLTEQVQQQIEKTLQGHYVAQSQFGTFRQETQQRISANSLALEQHFTNLQALSSVVEELSSAVVEVSATIRTGLLEQGPEGQSVYGVEIGQQAWENGTVRFRRYARLTAQRLSFYDSNDVEVAYISDRRLYVTGAWVNRLEAGHIAARQLTLGDYILEQGADGHLSIK